MHNAEPDAPQSYGANTAPSSLFELEYDEFEFSAPTQPVQPVPQPSDAALEAAAAHLWGFLEPLDPERERMEFSRAKRAYVIGRGDRRAFGNDYVLDDPRISNRHCMITWDGVEDGSSRVEILDLSRNGTFVNGTKLGKDAYIKLKDGDRVAFGSTMRPPSASTAIRGYEDNRYVFYHTACKMSISATPASP